MNNSVGILKSQECCGCGACLNICPQHAISMEYDIQGFLYPVIDISKCNNCGLCKNKCQVLSSKKIVVNPECYAFMAQDDIRVNSTSGGAFPILAKYFIENNGYVCGAIWTDNWKVKHIVSNKLEDIEKMQGSKYVQSDMNSCYLDIKNLLNNDKLVLFTGTPCQVAGLKKYLSKDYKNLYCIDIICHGVPSYNVLKKYLDNKIENNEKITKINFREKIPQWTPYSVLVKTDKNTYLTEKKNDDYLRAFIAGLSLRECCGKCKYANLNRLGDITLGDFWGINTFKSELNDNKGTSEILVNTSNGKFLFNILKKCSKKISKVPLKYAVNNNKNLRTSSILHERRNMFFDNLEVLNFSENINNCLDEKCDCMITNLWRTVNYGAVLTCYGVQCLLESLGKSVKVIDFVLNNPEHLKYEGSFTEIFAKKYLNLTKNCKTYEDLIELNKYSNCFVSGSDQVFAGWIFDKYHCENAGPSPYLLHFVNDDKKRISYAGSFGTSYYNAGLYEQKMFKHYIKQFDAVSVREDTGVEILKNDFGINAEHLLDGAFHIPYKRLEEMTAGYEKKEKYIAYFSLPKFNQENWQNKLLEKLSKKLNLPIKRMKFNRYTSVEEWLAFIKNADFVVSNSYHALVFSIILNHLSNQFKL